MYRGNIIEKPIRIFTNSDKTLADVKWILSHAMLSTKFGNCKVVKFCYDIFELQWKPFVWICAHF